MREPKGYPYYLPYLNYVPVYRTCTHIHRLGIARETKMQPHTGRFWRGTDLQIHVRCWLSALVVLVVTDISSTRAAAICRVRSPLAVRAMLHMDPKQGGFADADSPVRCPALTICGFLDSLFPGRSPLVICGCGMLVSPVPCSRFYRCHCCSAALPFDEACRGWRSAAGASSHHASGTTHICE